MDQGVSLFIDPTGAETGGRVVKRTLKEIGDAAIGAQQKINMIAGVTRDAAKSAEGSFRVIAQQQDQLREKYDQVFAAQQRYTRALEGINEAQRLGAITASQRIDLALRETNALNAQINTWSRLAQTRKEAAQAAVDRATINPNRGADIAAYGAALDALQAKFDPLFAASLRYKNILEEIDRAQKVGAISASQAIEIRMKEKQALDAVTNSASLLASQQKALAQEVVQMRTVTPDRSADVDAYGKSLDELRSKYSPLFNVTQQYLRTKEEIKFAHRTGAISTDEMVAALGRERQATLASISSIKGHTEALQRQGAARSNLSALNTGNITAQFQDIAVTSAMGMSPLQIGLQQGTQMALVFEQMKASGGSMASVLRGAFMQLIGPISLVTIGLTVGASALIQYFMSVKSETKTADDAIKNHADTIKSIKDAYGEAADGLGDYVEKSQAEAAAAARNNLKVQQDILKTLTSEFSESIGTLGARTGGATDIKNRFQPFADAIREFRQSVREGKPDFIGLRSDIEAIVKTDPGNLRVVGDELLKMSEKAGDADRRVRSAKDVIRGIGDIANEQVGGIGSLKNALNELSQIALPALTDSERALKLLRDAMNSAEGSEQRRLAVEAYDAARARIDNQNPTLTDSNGRTVSVPTPGAKPVGMDEDTSARLLSMARIDVSPAIAGMNTFAQSTASVGAAAAQSQINLSGMVQVSQQSASGVVDVTRQLADARRAQLGGFEQTGQQLRTLKTQLAEVQQVLAEAAKTPVADVFGQAVEGGAEAIAQAVANVNTLFAELNRGEKSALDVYEALGKIRAQLVAMGGDTKAIDLFFDSVVNGSLLVGNLESRVESLSQSIAGIPNRMISIGYHEYSVGGGKTVGVYTSGGGYGSQQVAYPGGNADFSYQSYNVGGKSIGVSGGNGYYGRQTGYLVDQSEIDTMNQTLGYSISGARAAGGPVAAGGTYLVGEEGPELVKMAGSGAVSSAGATASLLSGGRDTLSLIEDHLYNVIQELRIHTNYWETAEANDQEIITCLKSLKSSSFSGGSSYSSGGGGSSSGGGGGYSGGGGSGGQSHTNPLSPYYFNASRNFAGRGGGRYDPVADAMLNGNTAALYGVGNGSNNYLRQLEIGGTGAMPSLLDRLKGQVGIGFANNGQIMPGEDQKVELFKRNKERVIIVDDNRVSDERGKKTSGGERPVVVNAHFHGGAATDPRSRQAQLDDLKRTVQQALRQQ